MGHASKTAFYGVTSDMGFTIDNVYIEGRLLTDISELQKASGVMRNASIFAYDLDAAADRVAEIDWVESASIRRDLPDTVYIDLKEKTPLALLREEEGKLSLVDVNGEIITTSPDERFSSLIIISGDGAAENFPPLMKLIAAQPDVASQIAIAKYVGQRRWNLYTEKNTRIQLPEEDVAFALSRLDKYQKTDYVLDQHVKDIDLRYPDRIVLQTLDGKTPRIVPAEFNL